MMRKLMIVIAAVVLGGMPLQAKTVKTTFYVGGGCQGMCKPAIENAAKSVKGVVSAKWNLKTQKLTLIYDNEKTTPTTVQKAIVATGRDAGKLKATEESYNALPACCKYRK